MSGLFKHLGERQVVLGQREELAERHEVRDRDLIAQAQAVGAGDRDAARLQGRHHRRRERPALAHEDEDVAGLDGAALGGEPLAAVEPRLDRRGDALGELHGRRADGLLVERRPGVRAWIVVELLRRPDLDQAGMAHAMHAMADDRRLG